ncbi:MarR family winged helix-turn-helix transcriptional regulator [Amycolatopsis regifaucium]|uniref:MarR family transcriptional regulator n=1 Tax=Amycolatopsis regifaucium TaxID=546365 RepID=A0A154MC84_9PSEU|nr:MarR family transcriptional regulator [Amycolatopsis regifaucium]KZB82181.1 MarR family transcriptional regulator [Amycolatopsis regifaucium]OKA05746.1 MarR family transcriptional regulator [Amycolatopsis regifaucium]SFG85465.1 DNA-binding transcriptional regulator, MarR family [Amycolatopsis regifaucium]
MSEERKADAIDAVVGAWRRERPDLELTAIGVAGRLGRVALLMAPMVEAVFAKHGLKQGEFDVLAALRRSGEPYTLIPSELSATLMMSRAGMTSRIDRLESAGLVERALDPEDRRSFRVTLTERGFEVVDAAMTEHTANVTKLLAPLGEDIDVLDASLRRLLTSLEN